MALLYLQLLLYEIYVQEIPASHEDDCDDYCVGGGGRDVQSGARDTLILVSYERLKIVLEFCVPYKNTFR
jgi:hypothetical protein